jgi:hypothetical protein
MQPSSISIDDANNSSRLKSCNGVTVLSPSDAENLLVWISTKFPVTASGVDWGEVVDSTSIENVASSQAAKAALSQVFLQHGISSEVLVEVTWSDGGIESLRMPLETLVQNLELVLSISPGMLIVPVSRQWIVEFDFYDCCNFAVTT